YHKRDERAGRVDLIACVVLLVEPLMRNLVIGIQPPAAPQREEPLLVEGAFECAAKIEEIVVAPQRREQDERGGGLEPRAGFAVPGEAIGEASLDDIDAVDEAALDR